MHAHLNRAAGQPMHRGGSSLVAFAVGHQVRVLDIHYHAFIRLHLHCGAACISSQSFFFRISMFLATALSL